MKIALAIIMCSYAYGECMEPYVFSERYASHYECMIAGYEEALNKAKEIGPEEVNKYGTIIKFFCVEENLILPEKKPVGQPI